MLNYFDSIIYKGCFIFFFKSPRPRKNSDVLKSFEMLAQEYIALCKVKWREGGN